MNKQNTVYSYNLYNSYKLLFSNKKGRDTTDIYNNMNQYPKLHAE